MVSIICLSWIFFGSNSVLIHPTRYDTNYPVEEDDDEESEDEDEEDVPRDEQPLGWDLDEVNRSACWIRFNSGSHSADRITKAAFSLVERFERGMISHS